MKARFVSLLLGVVLAPVVMAQESVEFDRALQAYECSHYAESIRLLRVAAQHGHLRAQEMLGLMLLFGPALYGADAPRDPAQAQVWLRRAASAGSAVATYSLQRALRRVETVRRPDEEGGQLEPTE